MKHEKMCDKHRGGGGTAVLIKTVLYAVRDQKSVRERQRLIHPDEPEEDQESKNKLLPQTFENIFNQQRQGCLYGEMFWSSLGFDDAAFSLPLIAKKTTTAAVRR